ncbi:MAG: hypothetical protein JSW35_07720 [Deltaproteobacteria bacterium]|nr:MAG: hypothetical protein JSW35_07720 [Deltaproteobacteria bacterium]
MRNREKRHWPPLSLKLPIHNEPRLLPSRKWMPIASLLLTLLALMFSLAASARAYNYEGEIDPRVIYTWEVVEATAVRGDGMYFIVSKNPDTSHSIKYVLFKVYYPERRLVTLCAYYKDGELFVYELDYKGYREGECYFTLVEPTPEGRKEIDSHLKPHLERLEKEK